MAISTPFLWRSEAAPRRSLKWRVTYRIGFVPVWTHFGAVWTHFFDCYEHWNQLRLKYLIFRSEDSNLVHQTRPANRAGTIFNVCERLLPPRAVAAHTIPDSISRYCSMNVTAGFTYPLWVRLLDWFCNPHNENCTDQRLMRHSWKPNTAHSLCFGNIFQHSSKRKKK